MGADVGTEAKMESSGYQCSLSDSWPQIRERGQVGRSRSQSIHLQNTESAGIRRFRIIPYQGSSDTSKWWVRDLAKTWRPVKISRWNFPYFIQKNGMGNTWAGQRSQHLPLVLNTPRCRYYLISFSIHWVRGDVPITLVLRTLSLLSIVPCNIY